MISGRRQRQEIVVALQIAPIVAKALAAVAGLVELVALDHRPHGAVEQDDALLEEGFEPLDAPRPLGLIDGRYREGRGECVCARRCIARLERARGLASLAAHAVAPLSARLACASPAGRTPSAWQIA